LHGKFLTGKRKKKTVLDANPKKRNIFALKSQSVVKKETG